MPRATAYLSTYLAASPEPTPYHMLRLLLHPRARARARASALQVVPADKTVETAVAMGAKIASFSKPVIAMAKEAVNASYEGTLAEGVRFERRMFHGACAACLRFRLLAALPSLSREAFGCRIDACFTGAHAPYCYLASCHTDPPRRPSPRLCPCAATFATADQKEGMAAFVEKRKPAFKDA